MPVPWTLEQLTGWLRSDNDNIHSNALDGKLVKAFGPRNQFGGNQKLIPPCLLMCCFIGQLDVQNGGWPRWQWVLYANVHKKLKNHNLWCPIKKHRDKAPSMHKIIWKHYLKMHFFLICLPIVRQNINVNIPSPSHIKWRLLQYLPTQEAWIKPLWYLDVRPLESRSATREASMRNFAHEHH